MIGKFITFEGPDGSGKSSNIETLANHFRSKGFNVTVTREPGGTEIGEKIRSLLLNDPCAPMTELLLFAAARSEHIFEKIMPAIARGDIVISDRFSDSTYAYQGHGRGMIKWVDQLENFVHRGFEPDYTLFFDVSLDESMRRLTNRQGVALDVFEKEHLEFRTKVYEGYQERFRMNPARMVHIDAMQDLQNVKQQVIEWADRRYDEWTKSAFGLVGMP